MPSGPFSRVREPFTTYGKGEDMTAKGRLVVIGGDAAGMSAASQARRRRPELEIVAFERSPHTSYSA
jgi:NAD(P)-binding Rossmann-like domain